MEGPTKPDHPPDRRNDAGSQDGAKDRRQQGRGRNPYKGRHPYERNHKPGNKPDAAPAPKEKFNGRSDDLEGYIYSVAVTKGGVQFSRTTEEIARYAGEKYSSVGAYIRTAVLTMAEQTPTRPTAPAPTGTPPAADAVDQAVEYRLFRKH